MKHYIWNAQMYKCMKMEYKWALNLAFSVCSGGHPVWTSPCLTPAHSGLGR